jgi:DNA-binding MarR family transcriptional regulator
MSSLPSSGEDALADFRLEENVSHLLRRAHFRAESLFAARLEASGLTPRQKALLIAAYQQPGSTLSSLAEAIVLDRQTTAEMAERLVRRKLLARRRSVTDRRAYEVWITPAGLDLIRAVMPADALVSEEILAPLPPEYRPLFIKCLHLMVDSDGHTSGPD